MRVYYNYFCIFIYNYVFNNGKYIIKMASISKKQCFKCYRHFDTTFFTSQTGRVLKICVSCREQVATIYQTRHSNKKLNKDQLEHLYWNDIKQKLHDKIIEI